jgi:hypothetical protein
MVFLHVGVDHATPAPSRASEAVDLAGAGRLYPAAPGPPSRGRRAAAVGAASTAATAVTLSGWPRVSAATGPARLTDCCAETLGMPTGPAQRSLLGSRDPLPGSQEVPKKSQNKAVKPAKAA